MNLDFSQINDDQLIQLIRLALQEAASRTLEVKIAAQTAFLDEAEKARLVQEAATRESARLNREEADRAAREAVDKVRRQKEAEAAKAQEAKVAETWKYKEEMGVAVSQALNNKAAQTLKVWNKGDKRIYIGGGYGDNMLSYFHTGTSRVKPGHILIEKRPGGFTKEEWTEERIKEVETRLRPILAAICEKWNGIEFEIPGQKEEGTNV